MPSKALEIFKQALELAIQEEELDKVEAAPEVEAICSDEQDPVDEPVVSAAFHYSVFNGDKESPFLSMEVDDFSTENLECLAKLIAPMSHPQFYYLVLAKLQRDFQASGNGEDFDVFYSKVEEYKADFESDMDEPFISPLELSRGGDNE